MPNFALIDAHVHFYAPERLSYPWLASVPLINGTYLPQDFQAASEGVDVERMVFVEVDVASGQELDEARFIDVLAQKEEPRIGAIVASAPIELGAHVEPALDALANIGRVTGVRRLIQYHPASDYCLNPDFIAGVRLLAKYGFSFDICIRHQQLASATELVRRCPDVNFVLDHIAKPGIAAGLREPWMKEMRAIAALPNVVCKMTGVTTEADRQHWTLDDIRPYIEHAFDCFGFSRMLFASDWPVMNMSSSYSQWVHLLDDVLQGVAEDDLRRFYRDNALHTYRF